MKVTREGISINYKGVLVRYHWPILQTFFYQSRFIIPTLNYESGSFIACLKRINELCSESLEVIRSKVVGFYHTDIINIAAIYYFKDCCGISIQDVNVQAKPTQFWSNLPRDYVRHFLKDVVFITCKTPEEVKDLMYSIPEDFGRAVGYNFGKRICDNISV